MGARSATIANGYDRFWRNVRIHTLHNPAEYKTRNVGSWFLTGAHPILRVRVATMSSIKSLHGPCETAPA
jgi:hypothetical protein